MRVIRTEAYFTGTEYLKYFGFRADIALSDMPPDYLRVPVSFAWIKTGVRLGYVLYEHEFDFLEKVSEESRGIVALERALRSDPGAIQGGAMPLLSEGYGQLLETDIVVEQSPLSFIPFKELLSAKSSVGIGAFTGAVAGLASGMPLIMLVTVPLGILLVGTTVGVTKGLERGLERMVDHRFDKSLSTRQ